MTRKVRFKAMHYGATAIALSLFVFASGCKKKVPPPPPPPPPTTGTTAQPSAKPTIDSFTVEPSTIQKGQSAVLRWSVTDATDISIDHGVGPVQSNGQRQIYPTDTTTYTLSATGPGGTSTRDVTVTVTGAEAPPPPAPVTSESVTDMINNDVHDAYYDYDKSDVRDDARAVLTSDADVLKKVFQKDASVNVMVEGHCDERGSAEYNLALGDRRATAAKDFLVQLGVPADRLKTISYGKERPQCTDATEECYQKNRRAHFSVAQ